MTNSLDCLAQSSKSQKPSNLLRHEYSAKNVSIAFTKFFSRCRLIDPYECHLTYWKIENVCRGYLEQWNRVTDQLGCALYRKESGEKGDIVTSTTNCTVWSIWASENAFFENGIFNYPVKHSSIKVWWNFLSYSRCSRKFSSGKFRRPRSAILRERHQSDKMRLRRQKSKRIRESQGKTRVLSVAKFLVSVPLKCCRNFEKSE